MGVCLTLEIVPSKTYQVEGCYSAVLVKSPELSPAPSVNLEQQILLRPQDRLRCLLLRLRVRGISSGKG